MDALVCTDSQLGAVVSESKRDHKPNPSTGREAEEQPAHLEQV